MFVGVSQRRAADTNKKLLQTAIGLFLQRAFVATTVDEICERAGVTKGAFFHHFDSKEALAESCLAEWDLHAAAIEEGAPFQAVADPLEKLLASMDYYIQLLQDSRTPKSCLAGTTAQEVSDTHPKLRKAANHCLNNQVARIKAHLDAACASERKRLDTDSLARLWIGTFQGSLLLGKASRDVSVIPENMKHVRDYIRSLFAAGNKPRKTS